MRILSEHYQVKVRNFSKYKNRFETCASQLMTTTPNNSNNNGSV